MRIERHPAGDEACDQFCDECGNAPRKRKAAYLYRVRLQELHIAECEYVKLCRKCLRELGSQIRKVRT